MLASDLFPSFTSCNIPQVLLSNLYKGNNMYKIEMEVPGVKREDITIDLQENNKLKVKVDKKEAKKEGMNKVHSEIEYGKYSRIIDLPDVEYDKIEAELNDGILSIMLPAKQKTKQQIKIK